jgi:hypothetical protein
MNRSWFFTGRTLHTLLFLTLTPVLILAQQAAPAPVKASPEEIDLAARIQTESIKNYVTALPPMTCKAAERGSRVVTKPRNTSPTSSRA